MDRQYLQLEELHIPKPVRLAFHRLDFVVRSLHRTARDHHVVLRKQSRSVHCERFGHLMKDLDVGRVRTSNPAIQERGRECFPWLVPEPSQWDRAGIWRRS